MIISINKGEKEVDILNFDYAVRRVEGDPNNFRLLHLLTVLLVDAKNYSEILGTFNDYYRDNSISSIDIIDEEKDIDFTTSTFTELSSENVIFNVKDAEIAYSLVFQQEIDLNDSNEE